MLSEFAMGVLRKSPSLAWFCVGTRVLPRARTAVPAVALQTQAIGEKER